MSKRLPLKQRFPSFSIFFVCLQDTWHPKICGFLLVWRFLLFFVCPRTPILFTRCLVSCYLACAHFSAHVYLSACSNITTDSLTAYYFYYICFWLNFPWPWVWSFKILNILRGILCFASLFSMCIYVNITPLCKLKNSLITMIDNRYQRIMNTEMRLSQNKKSWQNQLLQV